MDKLLKVREVANILGLTPYTVRGLLRTKVLPGVMLPTGQWRVRAVDLQEFVGGGDEED